MKRTKKPTILVLDDDGGELASYFTILREAGYATQGAQKLEDAWRILETFPINLVLSDIHLSRDKSLCEGICFIAEVKEKYPHIILMAMSSDTTLNLADRAKAAGALTFIRKPDSVGEEFLIQVRQALDVGFRLSIPIAPSTSRQKAILKKYPEGIILTTDLNARIQLAIKNPDAAVILEGETGTGKEEIVRFIHNCMKTEHQMPLVSLNCAQLKGDLVLSTLFGHKKGAFTGAVDASIGAVGQANGGVLFLDEFHRLSHEVQEMLLRTLQDGTYSRVGDNKEMRSYFRLIIAAPRNLEDCAIDGSILMDLRFRLYGIDIHVPPLRERLDQIGDFVDLFFANYDKPYTLADDEREKLIQRCSQLYWQGNIRQLFGVLNILALNAQLGDGSIRSADLPVHRTMLAPHASQEKNDDEIIGLVQSYVENPGSYDAFINAFEKNVLTDLSTSS
ncbi:MAG: sigma 54-interacting transcriptional regulator [Pseudobdellovibrionaceae bacterium]|nr:sigma 54-interacting transcriptional regulator [Pseudobdellovibrionaceae bacterium]